MEHDEIEYEEVEIFEDVEVPFLNPEDTIDEYLIHIVNNLDDKDKIRIVLGSLFNKGYYHGWKMALKEMMDIHKSTLLTLKDL